MESAAVPAPGAAGASGGAKEGSKGLKAGALGYISNVVIGVASTAPGYSLAATLGFITAVVAFHAPAIMLLSFIPMLLIASAYYYMNRADPDCGTSFTWVTRAMGPRLGWLTGWTIVAADIVVMAALAYIAGRYTFLLFGLDAAANNLLDISLASVVWIALMTWICWRGIELSAMTQFYLLAAEVVTLALFAVVALVKVYSRDGPADSAHVNADWFNPFTVLGGAMLTGIFIKAYIDYKPADANYGGDFLGFGVSVAIGVGLILVGIILLVFANIAYPKFFQRKWEVAEPGVLEGKVVGEASVMEDPG